MKNIIVTLVVVMSTMTLLGQKITFNDIESVKGYLDDKKFVVGEYGTITFKYKEYDKDFNRIKFTVIYEVPGQKKPKKILFETDVLLSWDEFILPSFTRTIVLNAPGMLYQPNFNIPLFFDLYETGDLYYMDKPTYNMGEYIESKTSGRFFVKTGLYKLCN